jgi:hypothetical protein
MTQGDSWTKMPWLFSRAALFPDLGGAVFILSLRDRRQTIGLGNVSLANKIMTSSPTGRFDLTREGSSICNTNQTSRGAILCERPLRLPEP